MLFQMSINGPAVWQGNSSHGYLKYNHVNGLKVAYMSGSYFHPYVIDNN